MCTWAVSAVIDHYISQGSVVYGCAMDLSKAFDMVSWVAFFKTLQARAVLPIFLRVLLFVYTQQSCNVKWNGSDSDIFSVRLIRFFLFGTKLGKNNVETTKG